MIHKNYVRSLVLGQLVANTCNAIDRVLERQQQRDEGTYIPPNSLNSKKCWHFDFFEYHRAVRAQYLVYLGHLSAEDRENIARGVKLSLSRKSI